MNIRLPILLSAFLVLTISASALVVPFNEEFATGNSNWLAGNSSPATWVATGGVDGGGYISAPGTIVSSGFGAIVFRGNATNNASGGAFVGDWLAGGVNTFNAYVRHNALADLNIFARLDSGGGRAGSSVNFLVAPNTWTLLSVPILDSASSFQSYGGASPGGGVPNAAGFSSIFSGIQNIQIVVAPDSALAGQAYSFDVDGISVVPEPSTMGLVGLATALLLWGAKRRARNNR
jgi:hypothetical protein